MRTKKFIVWGLAATCTVCDRTFRRLPMPEKLWDQDWRWISWVFACNLAGLSAKLDERWGTGQWTAPPPERDRFPE